jgi:hypothetical protein
MRGLSASFETAAFFCFRIRIRIRIRLDNHRHILERCMLFLYRHSVRMLRWVGCCSQWHTAVESFMAWGSGSDRSNVHTNRRLGLRSRVFAKEGKL